MKREIGVTVHPRSLNPGKAIGMAICPIIRLFYYLARALMYDVACEFACAVRMRRNNSAKVRNFASCYVRDTVRVTDGNWSMDKDYSSAGDCLARNFKLDTAGLPF